MTHDESKTLLDSLAATHAKATPGPWRFVSDCGEVVPPIFAFGTSNPPTMVCRMVVASSIPSRHPNEYQARNNGDLIEAMYSGLSTLIALARQGLDAQEHLRLLRDEVNARRADPETMGYESMATLKAAQDTDASNALKESK